LVTDEYNNITATQGDYFVVGSSGFTHTLKLSSMDTTNNQTTFVDVGTGQTITISYVDSNSAADATLILDGFSYAVEVIDTTNKIIKVDLNGDGDIAGISPTAAETGFVQGADYSYYIPKLITSGQGGLYIYYGNQTVVPTDSGNGAMANVGMIPIALDNTSATAGDVKVGSTDVGDFANGSTTYVTGSASTGYIDFVVTCAAAFNSGCLVGLGNSATTNKAEPGFVLVEEAQQGSTTHNWIYFPITYSASLVKAGVSAPATDDANLQGNWDPISGSTTNRGMSTYGTYSEYDASLGLTATVKYPDSFSYGNVYVMAPEGSVSSSGAAGTVQTDKVLPITDDVVMLDSEVLAKYGDDYASGMDVVLFGGPCANTMVAKLAADGSFPYACDTWPGEDFGIVQVVEDAFEAGKAALVIAGTRAADTDMAGRVVQQGFPGATADQLAQASLEITGSASSPAYA
jgi:hypothetical protein